MSNGYSYRPPFTAEELRRDYIELRMSQAEIADKYETTQKVVWRALKKCGIPSRRAVKRNQTGEANSTWRGGRILLGQKRLKGRHWFGGYVYVRQPDHPHATRGGYVAEHLLVATRARGRRLARGEMVHHIDLDKQNNAEANLVITTAAQHARWHAQLEEVAATMLRDGLLAFSAERGYFRQ